MDFKKTDPIQSLLNSGADAYKNIWLAKFDFSNVTDTTGNITKIGDNTAFYRAEQFIVPKFSTEGDERTLWGKKIKVPKPEVNMDRTLTFTFRMDASYNLYDGFKELLHRVVNGQNTTGTALGVANWQNTTFKIKVYGYNGIYSAASTNVDETIIQSSSELWEFENCWVSDVSEPQFARDDASVLTFDVKINFGKVIYGDL